MRSFVAVLLLAASSAQAASIQGAHFSVTSLFGPGEFPPESEILNGDTFTFVPPSVLSTGTYYTNGGGSVQAQIDVKYAFAALPGYAISGYDATYDVSFAGSSYTVAPGDATEIGPVGSTWSSSATVYGYNGLLARLPDDSGEIHEHINGTVLPQYSVFAIPYGYGDFYCEKYNPLVPVACSTWINIPATVTINSTSITPDVQSMSITPAPISQVPEPSSWLLLLLGYAMIVAPISRVAPRRTP